ncbi:SubName: Full=Uncharacterized protein {ECO:0000313/EMBL:CCA78005.1} [Serendipita indica DSM 11827]|nr:SubName: Full=Uncharacterized protein {ECO:0000313/EMBL:CCA78005.1} [Serendipita indica DSM 11827]
MSTEEKNLTVMTVAQLMALCREHKLTGYSKLKKGALVSKLQDHYRSTNSSQSTALIHPSVEPQPTPSVVRKPKAKKVPEAGQPKKDKGESNEPPRKKKDKPLKGIEATIAGPSKMNSTAVNANITPPFERLDVRKLASNTIPTRNTVSMPPPTSLPNNPLNLKRAGDSLVQRIASKKPRLETELQNAKTKQQLPLSSSSRVSDTQSKTLQKVPQKHFTPLVPVKSVRNRTSMTSSEKPYAKTIPPQACYERS